LGHRSALKPLGDHNLRNALIGFLIGHASGIPVDSLWRGMTSFTGVKNRLQLLAEVDGVRYFNDLASTTPWATLAALEAVSGTTTVIIGGDKKAQDGYEQLAKTIDSGGHHAVFLPSEVSSDVSSRLPVGSFAEASGIEDAVRIATERSCSGESVVLSPAGAGFYSAFLGQNGSFNRSVGRLARGRRG
jgi:UDP-N-acetylmuramoylalanine--D-glutamate ligase